MTDDQEKIKIAREYFMRADQGRPDILELFQEDATISSLKALHTAECLVGRGQAAKLLAGVSATSSSFEMVAYRACTSISIPIIRVRMRRGFDGVGTINGESDDHPSGDDSWAC